MELYLKNLNCSHCASKIESRINDLPYITNARLNFIEKKIWIESKDQLSHKIMEEINSIVTAIEPGVIVYPNEKAVNFTKAKNNFSIDLVLIASSSLLLGFSFFIHDNFILFLLMLVTAYILVGFHVISSAVKNIFKGQFFDENFLMTIATLGAFAIGEYSEAVAVMLFYNIGESLQNKAVDKSARSIKELISIQPEFANLIQVSGTKKVAPKKLAIGDKIKILPGEKVPVDATVINGSSTLDAASITGESIPVEVTQNDRIISGMINQTGVLVCLVDKTYEDSTVSQIMNLVEKAGYKKSITENLITRFSKYYTPLVVVIAATLPLLMPWITGDPIHTWFYRSLVFLVISCPCAIVISIPLSYFAGIGTSSKYGILSRGSNFIESMARADTIVFDKTGTITKGKFYVEKVVCSRNENTDENKAMILSYAKKLEENSNHPLSLSIKSYQPEYSLDTSIELDNIFEIPGKGIQAIEQNKTILLGNSSLMKDYKIDVPEIETHGTIIYLSIDNIYKGAISLVDKVRDDAKETIKNLRKNGIKNIYMLTGDRDSSAKIIAEDLDFSGYKSGLLPQDKVKELEKIMATTDKKVVFVGDGTNDAPALALADLGIVMADLGSAAAIESSDVTIMHDQLSKVNLFYKISKKTRTVAMQNIAFSLMVKLIIMGFGIAGIANMWMAVFGDVGVSLLAIVNALRIMAPVNFDQH